MNGHAFDQVAPVNRATTGNVALGVHEFWNAGADAGDLNSFQLCPIV